jgi:hypothetical protein
MSMQRLLGQRVCVIGTPKDAIGHPKELSTRQSAICYQGGVPNPVCFSAHETRISLTAPACPPKPCWGRILVGSVLRLERSRHEPDDRPHRAWRRPSCGQSGSSVAVGMHLSQANGARIGSSNEVDPGWESPFSKTGGGAATRARERPLIAQYGGAGDCPGQLTRLRPR